MEISCGYLQCEHPRCTSCPLTLHSEGVGAYTVEPLALGCPYTNPAPDKTRRTDHKTLLLLINPTSPWWFSVTFIYKSSLIKTAFSCPNSPTHHCRYQRQPPRLWLAGSLLSQPRLTYFCLHNIVNRSTNCLHLFIWKSSYVAAGALPAHSCVMCTTVALPHSMTCAALLAEKPQSIPSGQWI